MTKLKDKRITRQDGDITFGIDCTIGSMSINQPISIAPNTSTDSPSTNVSTNVVYVLYGITGEHADKSTWRVRAYLDKNKAHARLDLLNQVLIRNGVYSGDGFLDLEYHGSESEGAMAEMKSITDGDPELRVDYTGSCYRIEEIPLLS